MTRSRIFLLRLLGVGVLAIGVSMAAPQIATAATTLPTPTTFGTSPAPLSGSATDPCGFTAPYGYIGAGNITFSAVLTAPSGINPQAEFLIVPSDGSASLDFVTASLPSGSSASVEVPESDFTDGTTYTWQVRETDISGDASPYTAACHFIADQTQPPAPAVSSTVFNSASPPVARTPGTFTFTESGPDAGAIVGFDYQLNGQLSVGSESSFPAFGNNFVPLGPDGTATTPTLIPTPPGPNFISVEAVDHAGNISDVATYQFFLGFPPPDVRGDLNGDGIPDLVAVTNSGQLQIYFGTGGGQLAAPTVFPDSGSGWAGALISQNGNFTNGPYQDLVAIQNGNLFVYPGNGLGDFDASSARLEFRPDDGTNWSAASQLLAPGDVTGDGLPDLITKEGSDLLLWPGQFVGVGSSSVIETGWSKLSLVGAGDFEGNGFVDLLARDNAGKLWLYPGHGDGTFGGASARVQVGKGFFTKDYPLITCIRDANGDGIPDLYATTAAGGLVFIPGLKGGGFGTPVPVTGTGTNWNSVTAIS